jgi:hypothetical protein
MMAV